MATLDITHGPAVSCATRLSIHGHGVDRNSTEAKFLESLAGASKSNWDDLIKEYPQFVSAVGTKFTAQKSLNELRVSILESDDMGLIKLYHRAVRNHDTHAAEKAEPVPLYYKHYQPPSFLIPETRVILDVQGKHVNVVTTLTMKRNSKDTSLVLDGRDHNVSNVHINGVALSKDSYKVTPHELIIHDVPDAGQFTVTISSKIDPFNNKSLEGLYSCGDWLTTQCESEGARRIFFTLDRPDVLSRITTTIIADPVKYPQRLSNGNLVSETKTFDNRACTIWEDPIPKPSYLFAAVLGNLSKISDVYTTISGKKVDLEVYVEPGKEQRAAYSLFALKKSMEFDEKFFDREYDLTCLKMVGVPSFNSGAMENKGLLIFNDSCLIIDPSSGSDSAYRGVAHVVAHEYFHNWSGNRVTVRNWFEIALKEAFTDFRAMLFMEWMFGAEFIRPKDVSALREMQFPSDLSEKAHPIMVESYVDAHSIYDHTTYTKGREVFRTLQRYIDMLVPGGFRKAQNLYFSRYDGQAVTFRELLAACNEVVAPRTLVDFERWFHQTGTPQVKVKMEFDAGSKKGRLVINQSNPHPKTKSPQGPLVIPFSYELLTKDGKAVQKDANFVLTEAASTIEFTADERPTPIFMHGYSAPVELEYDYSLEDLACIVKHTDDAFSRWDAGRNYSLLAITKLRERLQAGPGPGARAEHGEPAIADLLQLYVDALQSQSLSPLAKAQLLQIPSIRSLSQAFGSFDFRQLGELRTTFAKQLASTCKPYLESLLGQYPDVLEYQPESSQMQIRELRNVCYGLLANIDPAYVEKAYEYYKASTNFNNFVAAFNMVINADTPYKPEVVKDFYDKWKSDKAVFNYWLASQASASNCRVEDLKALMSVEGYDSTNPNHIRSVLRAFTQNLSAYHDPQGKGYAFVVDKILEIGAYNAHLAHNYIAESAFIDFENLPKEQRKLMAKEVERLQAPSAPATILDLSKRMLQNYRDE